MQRSPGRHDAGLWGVPGGKIEKTESVSEGAARELVEETGIQVPPNIPFKSLGTLYIRKPIGEYTYYLFAATLQDFPGVILSKEHVQFAWVLRNEIESYPLMFGTKEILQHYDRFRR